MPELPEVERAANLLRTVTIGKRITCVQTVEDNIVYSGVSDKDFASELHGRIVTNAGRYGKVMYMELDGVGRMPVLHFGMTGMFQIKGQKAIHYREAPRKQDSTWPPKFMKFILHLTGETADPDIELAFLDARRLGRIRLCSSPLKEPPISELGFDPILTMLSYEDFKPKVQKRTCPIKALLLDQSFSAGVGNWVADEVLYHARIHPEQRCNSLTDTQITQLHFQISEVCRIAVEVNADDSKFPNGWLFKHRWNKGKKTKHTLTLPSGEPATIKWLTVGGRTSAYVSELQRLNQSTNIMLDEDNGSESDLTPLSDTEGVVTTGQKRKGKATLKAQSKRRK